MYVPRAAYSFRMSFWIVPLSASHGVPRRSATTRTKPRRIAAGALIVIEIETFSSGIPSSSVSMSAIESIATPTFPTSPRASLSSESMPICVGRSKATERPVVPRSSRYRYRRFDSAAVENPAYCRIVQSLPRYICACGPRVKGNSPGAPRSRSGAKPRISRSRPVHAWGISIPDVVLRGIGDDVSLPVFIRVLARCVFMLPSARRRNR
jgi:hypothetical protein